MERHQLPVEVGEGDGIGVKEAQLPHPAAGQYLGGVAAHPADAEHRHMRAAQRVQRGLAQQAPGAIVLFRIGFHQNQLPLGDIIY